MKPLAVWLDRYAEEACPGLDQALAMRGIVVLRCFERTPSPSASRRLEQYRQAVVLGGKDLADRAARVELATTTLTWPVVVIAPRGTPRHGFGAGVVDVIEPQGAAAVASRIALMSEVPIVTAQRPSGERPRPPSLSAATSPAISPLAPSAPAPAAAVGPGQLLAVVSSTGGSFVVADLLRALPRDRRPAVVLAQHLEAEFVPFFAEWLGQASGWRVTVVTQEAALVSGTLFLAAGGLDLAVDGDRVVTRRPVSHWIPSGDTLLRSVATTRPQGAIGLILSGMGADGAQGLRALANAGGVTLCQTPASSIVPSMPERALEQCPSARALSPEQLVQALSA